MHFLQHKQAVSLGILKGMPESAICSTCVLESVSKLELTEKGWENKVFKHDPHVMVKNIFSPIKHICLFLSLQSTELSFDFI